MFDAYIPMKIEYYIKKKVIFQPWEKKLWMFVVGSLWALKGNGCISLFWNLATSMERSLRSIAKRPMLGKVKKPNAWKTQMANCKMACTLVLDKKRMLLDVVCFFNEYHVNMARKAWLVALQIWTYLCNTPNILFQILEKNILFKVGLHENMTLHDQVQDTCRNITCPKNWISSYKQNDGIQLWDPRKIVQAVKDMEATKGMKTTKLKKKLQLKRIAFTFKV